MVDDLNIMVPYAEEEKNASVELRRVPYDIDIVAKKMKALGFEEKFYINLYAGARIGGNIDTIELQPQ